MKLPRSYYLSDNVVEIARDLIGKTIFTNIDGLLTAGTIIETEAYAGIHDKASHAYNGRRTARTEVMYSSGGVAYVYLCYGIHSLFNIVTGPENIPDAVLIRGVKITHGEKIIRQRLGKTRFNDGIINGPGKVCKALGLNVAHTGTNLEEGQIWLETEATPTVPTGIISAPRVGIDYAGLDASLPYRFIFNPRVL